MKQPTKRVRKIKGYTFAHEEGWYKKFRKFSRLLELVRKIPDWELKYTVVMKEMPDYSVFGAYDHTKKGLLTVKF